jgi:predicted metal-dependent hydrolase
MEYEIQESTRAKYLRVTVHPDGRVVVTKPIRVSEGKVRAFLLERREWVEEMRTKMRRSHERTEKKYGTAIPLPKLRRGTAAYREIIARARNLVHERSAHFAAQGGFEYGTLSIRNQSSRWGSCSMPRKGLCNLSFNYRIAYLPTELVDYLIVHELAHTRQHNHSKAFWAEVAMLICEPEQKRRDLQRYQF